MRSVREFVEKLSDRGEFYLITIISFSYAITASGRKEFTRVLRNIIATPRRESSEFMAAMSFLVHLTPTEAVPRLEERAQPGALARSARVRCGRARLPRRPAPAARSRRLRPRARLSDPREGEPRPASLPRRSGQQHPAHEGDGPQPARRRA